MDFGYGMGGVCSGGALKKRRNPPEPENDNASRFSGKLNSMGSFGEQKNDDDSYPYSDGINVFGKLPPNLYDSGELHLSISCELKPSTPARTPHNKVYMPMIRNIRRCVRVSCVYAVDIGLM